MKHCGHQRLQQTRSAHLLVIAPTMRLPADSALSSDVNQMCMKVVVAESPGDKMVVSWRGMPWFAISCRVMKCIVM